MLVFTVTVVPMLVHVVLVFTVTVVPMLVHVVLVFTVTVVPMLVHGQASAGLEWAGLVLLFTNHRPVRSGEGK